MQLNTFTDERMESLYALSFMYRGMAQVWDVNETNVVLSGMLTIGTLEALLLCIEDLWQP